MMLVKCKKSRRPEKLDLISQLTEPLIRDIMYRLPERDSARAAVLSKTWKSYSTLYPILHFDHHLAAEQGADFDRIRDMFMDDVDHHLSRAPLLNSPIRKIALSVCIDESTSSRVDKWLHLVGQVVVEDLFIEVGTNYPKIDGSFEFTNESYVFPISLLALRGLRSLHVGQCILGYKTFVLDPMIKGEVSFFGLKELYLSNVLIEDAEGVVFNDLIRCCQGLETLVIRSCIIEVELLKLSDFPKLKIFIIEVLFDKDMENIDIADSNLQCLKCDISTKLNITPAACARIRELLLGFCTINQPNLFKDLTATFPCLEEAEIYMGNIDTLKAANNVLRKLKFLCNRVVHVKDVHIACPNLTDLDLTTPDLTDLYVACPKLRKFRFCGNRVPDRFFIMSSGDLEEIEYRITTRVAYDTLWLINLRAFIVHIMGSRTYVFLNFCLPMATFEAEEVEAIQSSPLYNVDLTLTLFPNDMQNVDALVDGVLWIIRPATLSVSGTCYYAIKYLCEILVKKSKDNSFGAQVTHPCWLRQLEDFQIECPLNISDIKENLATLPDQCRTLTDQIRFKFDWSKKIEDVLV